MTGTMVPPDAEVIDGAEALRAAFVEHSPVPTDGTFVLKLHRAIRLDGPTLTELEARGFHVEYA